MSFLRQGDLIWVDFSPTVGHEQKGRRPALVVSADEFNKILGDLVWAIPVTSQVKNRPDELELPEGLDVSGVLLLAQLKALDISAREYSKIGHVPDSFMDQEVLGRLISVFTG